MLALTNLSPAALITATQVRSGRQLAVGLFCAVACLAVFTVLLELMARMWSKKRHDASVATGPRDAA